MPCCRHGDSLGEFSLLKGIGTLIQQPPETLDDSHRESRTDSRGETLNRSRGDQPPLARALEIWLAGCSICLIGSTAGLWFPAWLGVDFPAASLLDSLQHVSLSVDCWLSVVLLAGWLLIAITSCISFRSHSLPIHKLNSAASLAVLVAGVTLVLLNQHRLQPWHYQSLLFLLVLRSVEATRQRQLLQWLTISIYLYSALSKFDFQFAHTVGQDLMKATWQLLPGFDEVAPAWGLVWSIPIVELIVAVLLAFTRTRLAGAVLACLLHLVLILVLGPWGLGHSLGVLLWNAHFIGVTLLLFVVPEITRNGTVDVLPESSLRAASSFPATCA
ncbi:MAG: MauE/DoxX family redox-associated membrane protein, partial [Planctomycetota bacterium]